MGGRLSRRKVAPSESAQARWIWKIGRTNIPVFNVENKKDSVLCKTSGALNIPRWYTVHGLPLTWSLGGGCRPSTDSGWWARSNDDPPYWSLLTIQGTNGPIVYRSRILNTKNRKERIIPMLRSRMFASTMFPVISVHLSSLSKNPDLLCNLWVTFSADSMLK